MEWLQGCQRGQAWEGRHPNREPRARKESSPHLSRRACVGRYDGSHRRDMYLVEEVGNVPGYVVAFEVCGEFFSDRVLELDRVGDGARGGLDAGIDCLRFPVELTRVHIPCRLSKPLRPQ